MARTAFAFAGMDLETDERLLEPREWTRAQSDWAAELLPHLPEGPVLELCSGAGHIGLAAVRGSARVLVAVDREEVAAETIRANAERVGMDGRVEVRCGDLSEVVAPGEVYPLVVADPPWVPHASIGTYPQDPPGAIDGGADGLDIARQCVEVIAAHLHADGAALLQLGTAEQAHAIELPDGLVLTEVREYPRGVVACLRRPGPTPAGSSR
ncbi:class I SAM-dependent methyltransferase [Janibacter terrae]|uniref:Class I SAM-dependent methyltransferase n=1 Tax=Janibacter terrae TaxID=103817 RepID=A0ABZ2FBT8_9MICO